MSSSGSRSPLRVGLIGCGRIARRHLTGYEVHRDRAQLAALCSTNPRTLVSWSTELGGLATYTDYRDLLADPGIDAVDICLPHDLHREVVVAAAQAGKHVLCEKPLCPTPEDARAIANAVAAAGITFMCAHNQLYLPAVSRARELLEAGALGDVFRLRTSDTFRLDLTANEFGWRADPARAGGGVLIDSGYHPTYLLRYLAGRVPIEATAVLSRHRLTFLDAEDDAQVIYRFADGTVGEVETSWAYALPPASGRFSVVGSLGWLWSDGQHLRSSREGREETFDFAAVDTFTAEIGAFADAVLGDQRPLHTHTEGAEVLQMIHAAYQSHRQRSTAPVVTLDPDLGGVERAGGPG